VIELILTAVYGLYLLRGCTLYLLHGLKGNLGLIWPLIALYSWLIDTYLCFRALDATLRRLRLLGGNGLKLIPGYDLLSLGFGSKLK